ncbi:hypothetical protein COOONC_19000 [Cooperia oncophora]
MSTAISTSAAGSTAASTPGSTSSAGSTASVGTGPGGTTESGGTTVSEIITTIKTTTSGAPPAEGGAPPAEGGAPPPEGGAPADAPPPDAGGAGAPPYAGRMEAGKSPSFHCQTGEQGRWSQSSSTMETATSILDETNGQNIKGDPERQKSEAKCQLSASQKSQATEILRIITS